MSSCRLLVSVTMATVQISRKCRFPPMRNICPSPSSSHSFPFIYLPHLIVHLSPSLDLLCFYPYLEPNCYLFLFLSYTSLLSSSPPTLISLTFHLSLFLLPLLSPPPPPILSNFRKYTLSDQRGQCSVIPSSSLCRNDMSL